MGILIKSDTKDLSFISSGLLLDYLFNGDINLDDEITSISMPLSVYNDNENYYIAVKETIDKGLEVFGVINSDSQVIVSGCMWSYEVCSCCYNGVIMRGLCG